MVPALLSQGLLQTQEVYKKLRDGYYGLLHIVLTLAFMALSRIKNPEQLKLHKPGELGKIIGLDRVPEVHCLRRKLSEISSKGKAIELSNRLANYWISQDDQVGGYFFVDGHVRVYHGHKANRPKCHVSREKLCLSGTIDFWVNDWMGKPYFFVTGEVNEKLTYILKTQIIPKLKDELSASLSDQELNDNPLLPRFTLVFDREGYSTNLFKEFWNKYRIAVITYRKNVKDKWDEKDFFEISMQVAGKDTKMKLAEKTIEIDGVKYREIRKLSKTSHQTAIYTTNYTISLPEIAGKMFSRWTQENFFKYMIKDYDIDRLIEYSVDEINKDIKVVNPAYRNLSNELSKIREKLKRKRAEFMALFDDNFQNDLTQSGLNKKAFLHNEIQELKQVEDLKLKERKQLKYYITIADMEPGEKYNKLTTEKKLFTETIKMIAYRAETAIINILSCDYKKTKDEGRMLVKQIMNTDADIIPDYKNDTLTIKLHSLSTPRDNKIAKKLCDFLNETETIYPGTNLQIIYKSVDS